MDRRRGLAVASLLVLVLFAGCSAAGHLEMTSAADDATLAEQASRTPTFPEERAARDRQVVQRAIENGSATARSREPLVEPGLPFSYEERYYNLSWSVVGRQSGTSVRVGIDYNGTAPSAATVAYANLSARDREMLGGVLPPKSTSLRKGSDFYTDATYTETERDRSVLLAEGTEAVRYEGETYPVTVVDTESVVIETRRYAATLVANSSAEYADQLRSEYLFTLSELSDAERNVVEEAIGDTYYAETDGDEAFQSVLETFQRHGAIQRNEYRGTWLVRYDGETYLADLSYEGFDLT